VALRRAQPYSIFQLARSTSFIYEQGVLAYTTLREVRVLDLGQLDECEKVISINYIAAKLPQPHPPDDLHVAVQAYDARHDIIAITAASVSGDEAHLLVIRLASGPVEERCLLTHRLRSTHQLFVLLSDGFLYYGTSSAWSASNLPEWLIQGIDLRSSLASDGRCVRDDVSDLSKSDPIPGPSTIQPSPLQLARFGGLDLGSTVAFALHDGLFVAVTNQPVEPIYDQGDTAANDRAGLSFSSGTQSLLSQNSAAAPSDQSTSSATSTTDNFLLSAAATGPAEATRVQQRDPWFSHYRIVTFAADDDDPDLEVCELFRRRDDEGPICDTWTDLSLQTTEHTARSDGNTAGVISHHALVLVEGRREWLTPSFAPSSDGGGTRSTYLSAEADGWQRTWYGLPLRFACGGLADGDDTPHYRSGTEVRRAERWAHRESPSSPARNSHTVSSQVSNLKHYLRSKTKYSEYDWNYKCNVELVVDDAPWMGWQTQERLRLRVVSRVEESPLVECTTPPTTNDHGSGNVQYVLRGRDCDAFGDEIPDSEVKHKDSEIRLWPSDDQGIPDVLADLMCPGGKSGEVKGLVGNEGLIYSIGTGPVKSLIFICFDPSFGFDGMRKLSERDTPATEVHGPDAGYPTSKGKRRADSIDSQTHYLIDQGSSSKRPRMSAPSVVDTPFNNLSAYSHTSTDTDSALELPSDPELDTEPELDLTSDSDICGDDLQLADLNTCRLAETFCLADERNDSGIDLSASPNAARDWPQDSIRPCLMVDGDPKRPDRAPNSRHKTSMSRQKSCEDILESLGSDTTDNAMKTGPCLSHTPPISMEGTCNQPKRSRSPDEGESSVWKSPAASHQSPYPDEVPPNPQPSHPSETPGLHQKHNSTPTPAPPNPKQASPETPIPKPTAQVPAIPAQPPSNANISRTSSPPPPRLRSNQAAPKPPPTPSSATSKATTSSSPDSDHAEPTLFSEERQARPSTGEHTAAPNRPFWKEQAMYLQLRRGWWLR
jgi:hypothetical protein